MIIGKAIDSFDGEEIIEILTNAGIVVAPSSLGVPVPSIDGNGNLELSIQEKDLAQTQVLLSEHLQTIVPMEGAN